MSLNLRKTGYCIFYCGKLALEFEWSGKSKIKDYLLLWHIEAYFNADFRSKSSNGEKAELRKLNYLVNDFPI